MVAPDDIEEELDEHYDDWVTYLKALRDGLPMVRRALANVPTYMIVDDHDVTDDWNLTALWKDRVYSTDLGRTIIRNGLVSYAMFQAWGNDPAAFESGPNKELLDAIERLNPPAAPTFPDAQEAQAPSRSGSDCGTVNRCSSGTITSTDRVTASSSSTTAPAAPSPVASRRPRT